MNGNNSVIRSIGISFLSIQVLALIGCYTLIIWASIKSYQAGGDDDTLGIFITGFLLISIYLIPFTIFNYKLLKEPNNKARFLKLGIVFIFSILPVLIGLVVIINSNWS